MQDGVIPRTALPEILDEIARLSAETGLRVANVFHAGDGNLHPMLLIPEPEDQELMHRIHSTGRDIVKVAASMNGSLSGEHGVGIEKRDFMSLMYSNEELMAMWDVKQAFDPTGILNPGKVFPSAGRLFRYEFLTDNLFARVDGSRVASPSTGGRTFSGGQDRGAFASSTAGRRMETPGQRSACVARSSPRDLLRTNGGFATTSPSMLAA